MNLQNRLASGMFAPSELKKYIKDKWYHVFLVFSILIIISILPHAIVVSKMQGLNYQEKQRIKSFFHTQEAIPYAINDNTLVAELSLAEFHKYDVNEQFSVIFDANDGQRNYGKKMAIVFSEKEVYLYQYSMKMHLFNYSEYSEELNGIQFSSLKDLFDDNWEGLFSVVDNEFVKYKGFIVSVYILTYIFRHIITFLGFSLLITLFQMGPIRGKYSFGKVWKLSIYCLVPYVFGNVLAILFNLEFLSYIGMFMSLIHGTKMGRSLMIN